MGLEVSNFHRSRIDLIFFLLHGGLKKIEGHVECKVASTASGMRNCFRYKKKVRKDLSKVTMCDIRVG